MKPFLILNARLVDKNTDSPGAILVADGFIVDVFYGTDDSLLRAQAERALLGLENKAGSENTSIELDVIDADGEVLMPAFIDLHAHFRDPGHTYKEDIRTASRAAAAGGYGTVVLMPNTDPVISDAEAAFAVCERATEVGLVDVFQSVSLTRGFNGTDTSALDDLDCSAVPVATEDGREVASAAVMLEAMTRCAQRGVIVSCHCEDPDLAAAAKPFRTAALKDSDFHKAHALLAETERLLRLAEDTMTERNLTLAASSGCRVHIAHVSTAGALDAVRRAKKNRPVIEQGSVSPVTCEVTPHHLILTSAVSAIVNPPLRPVADRNALIHGLLDGTVDVIATDHAPHTAADKAEGAPGFSGIQLAFASCFTELVASGWIGLSRLSLLMSANPAHILGLERGLLQPGWRADLVLIDINSQWTVNPDDASVWFSQGKNTPLSGVKLRGRVRATWQKGRKVFPFS